MHLVDVIALERINELKYRSGNYRSIAMIPNGNPLPETDAEGYEWRKIAANISQDEAYAIMNGYPHATRMRCE